MEKFSIRLYPEELLLDQDVIDVRQGHHDLLPRRRCLIPFFLLEPLSMEKPRNFFPASIAQLGASMMCQKITIATQNNRWCVVGCARTVEPDVVPQIAPIRLQLTTMVTFRKDKVRHHMRTRCAVLWVIDPDSIRTKSRNVGGTRPAGVADHLEIRRGLHVYNPVDVEWWGKVVVEEIGTFAVSGDTEAEAGNAFVRVPSFGVEGTVSADFGVVLVHDEDGVWDSEDEA